MVEDDKAQAHYQWLDTYRQATESWVAQALIPESGARDPGAAENPDAVTAELFDELFAPEQDARKKTGH